MNEIVVQTEIEKKLGVTVVNPAYPPGHVRRYGAAGDENAIDTAQAVNRAMMPAPVLTKDEMHEREPLNIIMRYKAERTTIAEAAAEIRAYVAECMRRAAEPTAPLAPDVIAGLKRMVEIAHDEYLGWLPADSEQRRILETAEAWIDQRLPENRT